LCLDPKLHALVAENPRDISGNVAVGKNRTSSGYRGQDHLPGHERVDLTTMILVVGHALIYLGTLEVGESADDVVHAS